MITQCFFAPNKLRLYSSVQDKFPVFVYSFLRTLFVDCICTLSHCVYVVGVTLHVREDSGLVRPHKVPGAKELHRELSHVMLHLQDVMWNVLGQADLCRPPPGENWIGLQRCSPLPAEVRCVALGPDLKRPHLTQRMSLNRGLFPALQSLQNQLP